MDINEGRGSTAEERVCDCGSVSDWEEVGSTWICTACRERDVRENILNFKNALVHLETAESALRIYKVDTTSIFGLLGKLNEEICKIEIDEG